MRSAGQLFVGPDNGVFGMVVGSDAVAWSLDQESLFRTPLSATFHGRDVFASVAGHLAAGLSPDECGTTCSQWYLVPRRVCSAVDGRVAGHVVHVDRFGNLITNIVPQQLEGSSRWRVLLDGRDVGPVRRSYSDAELGSWIAYWGSGGTLEVALREGSAAGKLTQAGGAIPIEIRGMEVVVEVDVPALGGG
jgi:S-adenosylmethionine hydrolase